MSAWQVLIDGVFNAAELVALLLASPAAATEPPAAHAVRAASSIDRAGELHLLTTTFDVRLLGALADVRISQSLRNDSGEPVNLAARLPALDEYTEALRIHRNGRVVDLLRTDDGCGGDEGGEADAAEPAAGHARLAADEAIADALLLAPGETALIEMIATQPLVRAGAGGSFRLALPAHLAGESRALLVDQHDKQFVIVIADRAARGIARLTLRPDRGAAETVELGELGNSADASNAYIILLADRAALAALAAGAIEFEARAADYVLWSTLPAQLRTDASLAWLRAPE